MFDNTEGSDFIVRKWKWNSIQLFVLFAITFVAIYLTATIMYDIGDKVFFFVTLSCIFGALSWFTITFASRNRDLVMATEFQNAMLASAAQLSTRFCFITKRDGTIVYIDPGFQKLFTHFMHSGGGTIDGLLTYTDVDEEMKQKIIDVLKQNNRDQLLLALKDAEGNPSPMMVTIDPLPRPKGYFLFRGRDYVEKRSTENEKVSTEKTADATSALLLAQALYALPEGVLITDSNGAITYVNHTLEEWLGFGIGEMLARPLKLEQICHQYAGNEIGWPVFNNFEGELTLQHKNRTLVPLKIRQTLVRQNGNVLGLSAIISQPENAKSK
jgi:PAS domain-containing protein